MAAPATVEGAAAAITTAATTMTTTGRDVGDHGDAVVARWTGTTADTAHQRIRHLSQRTDVGAEVVPGLPKILTDYAAELRGAQADHAAGTAAAVVARASLTQATTAMTGATTMDEEPERATAVRLSGQAHACATEAVAASSHTIDAAIAREHLANETAATAVRTLTALLGGFTPTDPGQSPTSVRATEAADGYTDTGGGRDLAWIERTAQHVVNAAGGALDTAYIVPQGPGYLILRNMGCSHEEAMATLERDHERLRDVPGADTDSPEHQLFDLHDNIEAANAGTDGGGAREVVGAGGEVAWGIAPGVLSAYGHASPDPGMNAMADGLDTVHDRLEGEWGADTDTRLYQRSVLAGQIATALGGPGALKGAGALARAGREGGEAAATAAARDGITQANRDSAHGEALTDDAARDAAAATGQAAEDKVVVWASRPTKMHHIFDNPDHCMRHLVARGGGQEEALRQIVRAVGPQPDGEFTLRRTVQGETVEIRGFSRDGVPYVGTAFVPRQFGAP